MRIEQARRVVPACLLFVSGGILFCLQFFCFASGGVQTPEISPHGRNILFPTHMVGKI